MSSNEHQNPITPGQNDASLSTDSIRQASVTSPVRTDKTLNESFLHKAPNTNFAELNDDKLLVLATLAAKTLRDHNVSSAVTITPEPKQPNMFDNAKFEQLACAGLTPTYDSSAAGLIPMLNAIHIRRKNEVWYSATMIIQSQDSIVQKHTRGTRPTIPGSLLSSL